MWTVSGVCVCRYCSVWERESGVEFTPQSTQPGNDLVSAGEAKTAPLTQGWLTNHLEARCRLQNYTLSPLSLCLQLVLVPLVNPWTLTSKLWLGCVCLPGWVNGGVATFLRDGELSLGDLWSSSSLIDPVPSQTDSIFLHLSSISPCFHSSTSLVQWLILGNYTLKYGKGVIYIGDTGDMSTQLFENISC